MSTFPQADFRDIDRNRKRGKVANNIRKLPPPGALIDGGLHQLTAPGGDTYTGIRPGRGLKPDAIDRSSLR